MLGEKEAKAICNEILKRAAGDPAEIKLVVNDDYLTRFANNYIHQNVAERNTTLTVRLHIGKRTGTAKTNRHDSASLDSVIEQARSIAKASPESPEHLDPAEPSTFQDIRAFDERVAVCTPEERATAVGQVCEQAKHKDLIAYGALSTGTKEIILANTNGLFAYHMGTAVDFSTVVMESEGAASGWAKRSGWRMRDVPIVELGTEAIQKAEMGRSPRVIKPGEYPVILDHYATKDIIRSLNHYGAGALTVQEGRSWMNRRIGEKIFSSQVSIWDNGLDTESLPQPFDFEGTPKQRAEIVKDGIVIGPLYDRGTARKENKTSTGHALSWESSSMGPLGQNLFLQVGDQTVEEMILGTQQGLYITRFWYTRLVHPSDCVVTGMTRDGVFFIENGEIAYPVKNLRFTQSYIHALSGVESVGTESHLLTEDSQFHLRVPALKLHSFNFTGTSV
jgi:predicted Zn-dependent protease